MNITEHFEKLNNDTQEVFKETLNKKAELGKAHHLSA
jgi:hypothetical protein